MKREGLKATTREEGAPGAPNRLKASPLPSVPGQQLAGISITYVSTGEGWPYLSVAIDLFSRQSLTRVPTVTRETSNRAATFFLVTPPAPKTPTVRLRRSVESNGIY